MPSKRILQLIVLSLAVGVAWLLGFNSGTDSYSDSLVAQIADEQLSLIEQHEIVLAELRTQRDIAEQTSKSLQLDLQDLQSQLLDNQSTLDLYERIEGHDTGSGLDIDTVTRTTGKDGLPDTLHITLVQARGRGRVTGRIGVALVGERGGQNWREVLIDEKAESAPKFEMRFFQTIRVRMPVQHSNAPELHVDFIEILVVPVGKTHKAFTAEVEWAGILPHEP